MTRKATATVEPTPAATTKPATKKAGSRQLARRTESFMVELAKANKAQLEAMGIRSPQELKEKLDLVAAVEMDDKEIELDSKQRQLNAALKAARAHQVATHQALEAAITAHGWPSQRAICDEAIAGYRGLRHLRAEYELTNFDERNYTVRWVLHKVGGHPSTYDYDRELDKGTVVLEYPAELRAHVQAWQEAKAAVAAAEAADQANHLERSQLGAKKEATAKKIRKFIQSVDPAATQLAEMLHDQGTQGAPTA